MNTWSSRAAPAVFALGFLGGCDDLPDLSMINAFTEGRPDVALSQASMAFGSVDLVAPPGYCIDKRTLKQNFALMARCDTLGVPSAAGDAPLGIITASFAPAQELTVLPDPNVTAQALALREISDASKSANIVSFRAKGRDVPDGTDPLHWRATTKMGEVVVGLALFGPTGGRAIGDDGRDLLDALIERSGPTS